VESSGDSHASQCARRGSNGRAATRVLSRGLKLALRSVAPGRHIRKRPSGSANGYCRAWAGLFDAMRGEWPDQRTPRSESGQAGQFRVAGLHLQAPGCLGGDQQDSGSGGRGRGSQKPWHDGRYALRLPLAAKTINRREGERYRSSCAFSARVHCSKAPSPLVGEVGGKPPGGADREATWRQTVDTKAAPVPPPSRCALPTSPQGEEGF